MCSFMAEQWCSFSNGHIREDWTYMWLLLEYFPPFRRQYSRLVFFCSFKHASFGSSSRTLLSFLSRTVVEVVEGGPDEVTPVAPMFWTNRSSSKKEAKINKNTQPGLFMDALVAAAGPQESWIKISFGRGFRRKRAEGEERQKFPTLRRRTAGPELARTLSRWSPVWTVPLSTGGCGCLVYYFSLNATAWKAVEDR